MKTLFALKIVDYLLSLAWKGVIVAVAFSVSTTLGGVAVGILVAQLVIGLTIEQLLTKLEQKQVQEFIDQYLTKAIGGGNA